MLRRPGGSASGMLYAVGAYGLWGILPAYFLLLAPAGPIEIVGWRVLFSLVFCALLLTLVRGWGAFRAIASQPRLVLIMGAAGALIYVNWQIFVFAAISDQVLETSLGYFINPLFTVILGVVFLRERLRVAQWVAVSFGAIAVLVLALNYGSFPWIALSLALTFGLYGLIKKQAGARVDALSGLTIETMWLTPVAVIALVVVSATGGLTIASEGTDHLFLLLSAGVVTAVPLLLFAAGARRLPLVTLGIVQYLTPVLQFMYGAFVRHEAMPPERWVGFGLVWIALIVLTIDMLNQGRASRRASPEPA